MDEETVCRRGLTLDKSVVNQRQRKPCAVHHARAAKKKIVANVDSAEISQPSQTRSLFACGDDHSRSLLAISGFGRKSYQLRRLIRFFRPCDLKPDGLVV